MLNSVLLL
jgi:hypothetical protein